MGAVMISYLHRNTVSHSFMESVMQLVDYDRNHHQRIKHVFPVYSGPVTIPESRNAIAQVFLDQSIAEWLWILDSDVGFRVDTLDRLLLAADPAKRPVVSGLCMAVDQVGSDGMGGWKVAAYPTVFDWLSGDPATGQFMRVEKSPSDGVIRVAGAGAGCLLVHRSVLESLRTEGDQWFTRLPDSAGCLLGEDLSFCLRLHHQSIPLYLIPDVRLSHHKSVWITPGE